MHGIACVPLLQLVTPPGSQVYRILKGKIVLLVYVPNGRFLHNGIFSLPSTGLSSCSRLRGTQEARVNTGYKYGPWPRSVARALGVQSRENWYITMGSLSYQLKPTKTMQTRKQSRSPPHVSFSFSHLKS